jgi:drug/metabolite transporter (DMT)-like permease
LERLVTLYIYGSVFMSDCHNEREVRSSFTRNAEKAVILDKVELCRLCAFLCANHVCRRIRAGVLLSPFFYEKKDTPGGTLLVRQKIPLVSLGTSVVILIGAALIQLQHAESLSGKMLLFSVLPVVIAAFAYPLGNRRMLEQYGGRLDTFQRVLGMTLASLPFWLVLAAYGWWSDGLPTAGQTVQSFIVAVSSGIIATVLFFWATDMVRDNPQKLAAVEATQSGEVIFALLGEIILLSGVFPSILSFTGLMIIIAGMVLHTFASQQKPKKKTQSNLTA